MIHQMSRRITRSLIDNDIINFDDVSIYQYGMEVMLVTIVEIFGMLVLASMFGYLVEAVIFIMAFSSVRVYAGGYHAKTVLKCFIIFVMLLVTDIAVCNLINVVRFPWLCIILALIAFGIIYMYAPVAVKNRPLSESERVKFRKIAVNLSFVYLLVVTTLSVANIYSWYVGVFFQWDCYWKR